MGSVCEIETISLYFPLSHTHTLSLSHTHTLSLHSLSLSLSLQQEVSTAVTALHEKVDRLSEENKRLHELLHQYAPNY